MSLRSLQFTCTVCFEELYGHHSNKLAIILPGKSEGTKVVDAQTHSRLYRYGLSTLLRHQFIRPCCLLHQHPRQQSMDRIPCIVDLSINGFAVSWCRPKTKYLLVGRLGHGLVQPILIQDLSGNRMKRLVSSKLA